VLQDEDGQTIESHSISAGLDYPGVGPEHAHLAETGRATYLPVSDASAMEAMALLSRTEGIIPAIESAHAVAGALDLARERPGQTILVNLSGRGDKDMGTAIEWFGLGQAGSDGTPQRASDQQIAEGPGGEDLREHAGLRPGPGREPLGAGRLPARRLPGRHRRHRGDDRDGRGRL
jgi:tryptophan synthase beta chain